jgi:hypothetical protein
VKTDPHITFAYALVGLCIIIIGVLAGLHTATPEVLTTLALILAGGGVGATIPRSNPDTSAASASPTADQVAAYINTTLAQVQRPAPAAAPAPRAPSAGSTLVGAA